MSAQLSPDGPATSAASGEHSATEEHSATGEHSTTGDDHSKDQLIVTELPGEVWLRVLDQFRPTESVTPYRCGSVRPPVHRDFFESRANLTRFVLVSRRFNQLGTHVLYRTIFLNDQRETLLFFRTIAASPDHRDMVRSLAWVTVLSNDHFNREWTELHQAQADLMVEGCWNHIKDCFPRLKVDIQVAKLMGIADSRTLQTWRLLGAILALCPKIASLFTLHGSAKGPSGFGLPHSPELRALLPLLWDRGDVSRPINVQGPHLSGYGFLSELTQLTIDPHDDEKTHNFAQFFILLFLTNSPLLRRIEIKGNFLLEKVLGNSESNQLSKLLAKNVKELILLRSEGPRDNILAAVMTLPRLVPLEPDYQDASNMISAKIIRNPDYSISSALTSLADTLETLSMTTDPVTYRSLQRTYLANYPPSLTKLYEMDKLKELTAESMCLFGRADINITRRLPELLPPNLVRFRLIDYWGMTHPTPPPDDKLTLTYYPDFPDNWTTANFYRNVLMTLVGEKSPPLKSLREVTLVSKELYEELQTEEKPGDQGQGNLNWIPEAPLSKLRESMSAVGIQFNLEMQVEREGQGASRFEWARMG